MITHSHSLFPVYAFLCGVPESGRTTRCKDPGSLNPPIEIQELHVTRITTSGLLVEQLKEYSGCQMEKFIGNGQ